LVAFLLIGGGIGIGSHSFSLLLSVLSETASAVSPGPLQTALLNVTAAMHHIPAVGHSHVHAHANALDLNALDLNAAWFAAASVVAKEWLFQITRKVADQENSPVLLANAYHHRSDAYSSVVALIAILGSGWFPALPLDPLGGASRPKRHSFSLLLMFWTRSHRFFRHPTTRPLDIQGCLLGID
jgi:divalent metal cation (Fe/Co/Zn/Cd) transporter